MAEEIFSVGISGSYGGLNLGDEAILQSIVMQIRRVLPGSTITVFSRNAGHTQELPFVDRAVAIRDLTRDEARRQLKELDLFILGGGGILYDRDAEVYCREVNLAYDLGVPVMVYAVSAGPLSTRAAREAVADALDKAAMITVRDRHGKKLLEEVGVTKEIVVTADPALLLEPEPLPADALLHEGLEGCKTLVGFSIREPGPAAPDIDESHYHALLANAADYIVDRLDAYVVFVPMERENDIRHAHAVIASMQHASKATVLKKNYTAPQLITLMKEFRFALGMRLHFLIFAALQKVPFVALPYASKVAGFIEALGIDMPPLKSISAGRLIAYIDRSWDLRENMSKVIESGLKEQQMKAAETNQLAVDLVRRTRERRAA